MTKRITKLMTVLVTTLFIMLLGGFSHSVKAEGTNWNYIINPNTGVAGWYYGDLIPVNNPREEISEDVQLSITTNVEAALSELKGAGEKPKVNYLTLNTVPQSGDFVISDYIESKTIDLMCPEASSNRFIYNGNVEVLHICNGNITLTGDVNSLNLGYNGVSSLSDYHGGNVVVNGNVTAYVEIINKTENDSELTNYYTEEDVRKSIEASKETGYCAATVIVNGRVARGSFKNTYFNSATNEKMTVAKGEFEAYDSHGPILVEGSLSEELKASPGFNRYSTEKWYNDAMNKREYEYMGSYTNQNGYSWVLYTYANFSLLKTEDYTNINPETHLPNTDLKNARIFIGGTDNNGLKIPKDNLPLGLQVNSGKVVVDGNIFNINMYDWSKYYDGYKGVDLTVNGDVDQLFLNSVAKTTTVRVTGKVNDGEMPNSVNNTGGWTFSRFSKDAGSCDDIIKNGEINKGIVLKTPDGLEYHSAVSTKELEDAIGITEENNTVEKDGNILYKVPVAGVEVGNIDDGDKAAIDAKLGKENYQVGEKTVNADISVVYMGNNTIEKGEEVTTTKKPVAYTVKIPDYVKNSSYDVVRIHENADKSVSYDVLPVAVDRDGYATFKSDKFSSFVFAKRLKRVSPANNYGVDPKVKDYSFTIPVSEAGERQATTNTDGLEFYVKDGNTRCYTMEGYPIVNDFKCDGTYTYYFQADGTAMKDRLTYHPDGVHVIYFDSQGHEVFSNFANVRKTIAGEEVDDYCFFDVFGYLYVDVVTYGNAESGNSDKIYYANEYGVMPRGKWFKFSPNAKWAGTDAVPSEFANQYGYANEDGSLMINQATYDWEGKACYMQGNGVAKY